MNKKLIILISAFLSFQTLDVFAQYERPGSSSAQFLKIDVSPRASALAGSYISLTDGAEGVYHNSGALASIEGGDIAIGHTIWFAGISHNFLSVVKNVSPKIGTFALSVTALYTDEMEVRTPLQPEGTGERFRASNYRFGISYSRSMSDYVSFGGTINYIDMALYEGFSSQAFAFDLGILFETNYRDFSFGMQISNFGSDVNFYNEAYPLPTYFSFGGHANLIEKENIKMLITATARKPNDGAPLAGIGSEIVLLNSFAVRAGYKLNHSVQNFSAGAGYNFSIGNREFNFDYSWSQFSELGVAHRIGASFNF